MKATLIIDMPENCVSCPISTCYSCHVHGPQPHPRTGKPEWCPLNVECKEKYTAEQILDALVQANDEVVTAIRYQDKDMLRDILMDYLKI